MGRIKSSENQDVKDRILDASEELFSSKGYDATSIEQIAKKAEVTKSLIYYYFEGKEKILEELLSKYLQNTMKQKNDILSSKHSNISLVEQSMERGFDFLSKNKRIIRILITEMLKDNIRNEQLFNMIVNMISASTPNLNSLGMDIKDNSDFAMYSFFFGLVPVIAYMLLGDAWIKNNQLDEKEFATKFAKMARMSLVNDMTGIKDEVVEPINSSLVENLNKLLEK